jgi:hypothetical protein
VAAAIAGTGLHVSGMTDGALNGANTATGLHCRHVSGTAVVESEKRRDGSVGWVLTISSEARAALESHIVMGDDGREHPDPVALDCFVAAVLSAAAICSGDWRHDENIATHVAGGRLEVRGVCNSTGK